MSAFGSPDIRRHLLREEGEVVVDEVERHWVAFVRPALEAFVAFLLLVASLLVSIGVAWVLLLAGGAVALHAGWATLRERRDRFVVTNMRVFRIHGVLSTRLATMPLSRILDITVDKPVTGRIFGYGHFIFESAAQEQGLREIRYVGRPDDRDLTIQRVVQRTGLRGPRVG
ncbi:PH domain-containing protein [Nocardioides nematodiphilus]|uniref:PH domain-containing protein n=1 Tax=Nocardioides nematodiphilus TaxID=2849669 RepID=UPI001CD92DC6|nr:PH domain-containing protein [Nocardioides nematodiphilus]MCA1982318.1 PH domain-containing protein [Nocardioides nematodiphilus]